MNAKKESFPAFFFGMIGGIVGLIFSIVMIALSIKDAGAAFIVSLFLLFLPSIFIIVGSGICLKNAFVGRILISISSILCFIGLGIISSNIVMYFIVVCAISIIIAQLVLLFSHRSSEEKKQQD